jgi:transcription-repair coupling factor (superfamily II helicase)
MRLYHLNILASKLYPFTSGLSRASGDAPGRLRFSLPESAFSYVAAALYSEAGKPVLLVAAHPETARRRFEQIKLWLKPDSSVHFFPETELRADGVLTDPVVNADRMRILSLLSRWQSGAADSPGAPLVMASALSLAGKCMAKESLMGGLLELRSGAVLRQSDLLEKLQGLGYRYEEIVEMPGTFARRGGLVDVFPAGCDLPVRLDFFGNEIEGIKEFDPISQRSGGSRFSITILPAMEPEISLSASLIDYFPAEAVFLFDDLVQVESEIDRIHREIGSKDSADADMDGSGKVFLTWGDVREKIGDKRLVVEFSAWQSPDDLATGHINLPLKPAPNYAERFPALFERLPSIRKEVSRVLIVSQQAERISDLLRERGLDIHPVRELAGLPQENSLTLLQGSLDGGWQLGNELLLLSDMELFGIIKQRRLARPRPVPHHRLLNDISEGDLVVHVEHGIGCFTGVARKETAGVEREYLVLEYAGGDKLYVPVDQVDRVSLYIGGSDRTPSLHRLGSQEWHRAQQKVREAVVKIAGELLELYAQRELGSGLAYPQDTLWQQELEASFPYMETPDQLEAVAAVKADMQSQRPMDRLVCGDVGYGKTEIALRAAFKAVMDGRQVAVLVPTTILAQQHLNTFSERLKAFPVKLAALSRFCSSREQADIIDRLARGEVDICIGTHRLLQKDVTFKDLGLVVIDEEQRFGVVHKEYFKKMRQTVDVLTLSATPIPRTMHMALSGIRDMSVIETPPESRLPVITHVGEFNGPLVRQAVLREIERDGQVFIVHNRVHSINDLAFKLGSLVPEAKISVAHGQMDEEKLEAIMADFMAGKSDILLTTTIIESGLDMPNVNTLIIDGADRLGLTQLYQLRGRVGRGANTAYAYFLFDSGKAMTDQARERLKTIAQATELGAGFAIAMKDLEIRGAGNLLGVEQSGNIAAVGFNLYCRMLAEAVEELRSGTGGREARKKDEEPSAAVDLKIPAFIPEYYVENTRTRFNIYQRLARVTEPEDAATMIDEIVDRFGQVPEEVANLLFIVELKLIARKAGIATIFREGDYIVISLNTGMEIDKKLITAARKKSVRFGVTQAKLDVETTGPGWMKVLKDLVTDMANYRDI